jgi:hypothetical protein
MQELSSLHRIADNVSHFLCNFQYWQGKQQDPEGWIYKPIWRICKETKLTKSKVETLRFRLKELGIMKESLYQGKISYLINWVHPMFNELEVLKGKKQFTRKRDRISSRVIKEKYREFAQQIVGFFSPNNTSRTDLMYVSHQLDIEDSEGQMNHVITQFKYFQWLREEFNFYDKVTNIYSFFKLLREKDFQEIYEQKYTERNKKADLFGNQQNVYRNSGKRQYHNPNDKDFMNAENLKSNIKAVMGDTSAKAALKNERTGADITREYITAMESLKEGERLNVERKLEDGSIVGVEHALNYINTKYKTPKFKNNGNN